MATDLNLLVDQLTNLLVGAGGGSGLILVAQRWFKVLLPKVGQPVAAVAEDFSAIRTDLAALKVQAEKIIADLTALRTLHEEHATRTLTLEQKADTVFKSLPTEQQRVENLVQQTLAAGTLKEILEKTSTLLDRFPRQP